MWKTAKTVEMRGTAFHKLFMYFANIFDCNPRQKTRFYIMMVCGGGCKI